MVIKELNGLSAKFMEMALIALIILCCPPLVAEKHQTQNIKGNDFIQLMSYSLD